MAKKVIRSALRCDPYPEAGRNTQQHALRMSLKVTNCFFVVSIPDFDIALIRLDRWATLIGDDFASLVMPVCLEPPLIPTIETK